MTDFICRYYLKFFVFKVKIDLAAGLIYENSHQQLFTRILDTNYWN